MINNYAMFWVYMSIDWVEFVFAFPLHFRKIGCENEKNREYMSEFFVYINNIVFSLKLL